MEPSFATALKYLSVKKRTAPRMMRQLSFAQLVCQPPKYPLWFKRYRKGKSKCPKALKAREAPADVIGGGPEKVTLGDFMAETSYNTTEILALASPSLH
jgi:hypothetical protein